MDVDHTSEESSIVMFHFAVQWKLSHNVKKFKLIHSSKQREFIY